jgi:hypothetical protein
MALLQEELTRQRLDSGVDSPKDGFITTHIFYISPHSLWQSEVKIHDITSSITAPYPSEDFKVACEAEAKSRVNSVPKWMLHDQGIWKTPSLYTGTTTASTKNGDNLIATCKPSRGQYSKNAFTFPEGSEHSEHTVVMEREKKWHFDEVFVVNSVQYFWRYEGSLRRKFTLWKVVGESKLVVARYKGKMRLGRRGGTLLVNAEEVDCVVALMTMMGMLRKLRQRG